MNNTSGSGGEVLGALVGVAASAPMSESVGALRTSVRRATLPASPSMAADDDEISGHRGDDAAGSSEVTSMQHVQPPILAVVTEATSAEPAPAVWRAEAQAAVRAGNLARELALTLPCGSEMRAQLLSRADDWTMLAALRGVQPAPLSAAQSRSA